MRYHINGSLNNIEVAREITMGHLQDGGSQALCNPVMHPTY
ncbi:hypothetical protein BIW11_04547 [Tropilaelaps mercedesae]|uniref:Uncharacterized protein n=1 Tax=Tropilaelaps mercedesae TaxID=418985 RepID=A0A1V9X524_9ACAR|nr:hypothetical protein BIW11_04547 [Tropilaelaps mercedesae]